MMAIYDVLAEYTVKRVVTVEVDEGGDPLNPSDWHEVLDERDVDDYLQATISAEIIEE